MQFFLNNLNRPSLQPTNTSFNKTQILPYQQYLVLVIRLPKAYLVVFA